MHREVFFHPGVQKDANLASPQATKTRGDFDTMTCTPNKQSARTENLASLLSPAAQEALENLADEATEDELARVSNLISR